jgi:hypothetical protein
MCIILPENLRKLWTTSDDEQPLHFIDANLSKGIQTQIKGINSAK